MKRKIILFDCDGTLYPSTQLGPSEMSNAIKKEIFALVERIKAKEISEQCIKEGKLGIYNYLFAICDFDFKKFRKSCKNIIADIDYDRIEKNIELLEAINKLKERYEVYIFTNNVAEHVEKVFEKLFEKSIKESGITCFDIVSTHSKQARHFWPKQKDGLSVLCKKLNCLPQDCILFDDSLPNVMAAQKIEMPSVYVNNDDDIVEKIKALL